MIQDIINQHKDQFEKVIEHFHHELSSVRTGRANPALLSTVMVDSYGTKVPLQQVANITVSDAKTLTISPWDKGQLGEIEKGIQAANLGLIQVMMVKWCVSIYHQWPKSVAKKWLN